MLRGKASKGHRQIKAQGDIASSVVGKAVPLLVALFTAFAREDLAVFECRCINWGKAVRAKDGLYRVDHLFARHGQKRVENLENRFRVRGWINCFYQT